IYPIDVKVSQNRRTPHSTYVPVRSFAMIECLANGVPLLESKFGDELVAKPANGQAATPEDVPLVTVSITCRNHTAGLPEVLASVAAQTYPNLEVLVIDGGLTDPSSRSAFEALKCTYPGFRFVDPSSSAVRDRGLWEARGAYFIPMDTDTHACPNMAER